jgi:hypothetical protein
MIDKNNCYLKLGESEVLQHYFDNVTELNYVHYKGWETSLIPNEWILQEPLLKSINEKFKISRGAIIRMEPHHCYQWHIDDDRGVSINLLLTPEVKSFVYFGNKVSYDQYEYVELVYEPRKFYAFNNQIQHTIFNFDKPRYLFTLEFEKDKTQLSFDEIRRSYV